MASPAQIAANRRNSLRSTGPSLEARSRTRLNAVRHGLASKLPEIEAESSPEFAERRALWAAEQQPEGEAANFALDRAVAATFRIQRCERAFEDAANAIQERAELAWAEDRALEAAQVAARLARSPVLASRQLQTTLDGVILLIEAWFALAEILEAGDWSDAEQSRALDLLGVAPTARSGERRIDPYDGSDPVEFRKELARAEIARLEEIRDESMRPLDQFEQARAMSGASALAAKETRLILRYERDAWRRFRESMKVVERSRNEANPEPEPEPKPKPKPAPEPAAKAERRPKPAAVDLHEEYEEILRSMGLDPVALAAQAEPWLDAMEARLDAFESRPGGFVPIAVGLGAA